MSCHSSSSCKWGALIAAVILGAVGIQTFVALIATAVSIGNGYSMWFAIVHIFCWPVFFLSLFLSLLMTVACVLKRCCKREVTTDTGCCQPKQEKPTE